MLPFIRRRRRNRLMATPLPLSWWALIDTRVPAAARLSETERARLGGIVQILLNEKNFEGCAGLAMTDEIRLTIACQAALLVLNRPGDYYPGLYSILVYPAAYRAPTEEVGPLGIVTEDDEVRLGEAWTEGSVVLSWADVLRGARQEDDGRNVVIHEFAHLLDGQAGDMDGAPALSNPAQASDWARILGREYEELIDDVERGRRSVLDPYGATHPAEFFAVSSELFFERPRVLRRRHPDLYAELARFYAQDPAARDSHDHDNPESSEWSAGDSNP